MDAHAVGRMLRWARRRAGLTQSELAEAAKIPQPTIARVERGAVVPRTATLIALLAATGHELAVEPTVPEVDREPIRQRLVMDVPKRTQTAIGRAAKEPTTSPMWLIRRLRRYNVPFVLIGALAEAAHGAPVKAGRDVEICHAPTKVARDRLEAAAADFGRAADANRLQLSTTTESGDDYEVLARNAVSMPVYRGLFVRVAALEDLIRIRRARKSREDEQAVVVLRTLAEMRDAALVSDPSGRGPSGGPA